MASSGTTSHQSATSRIPDFRSWEEEAEFWDRHSFEEFEGELEEVTDIKLVGLSRDGRLFLWLEPEAAAALTKAAAEQGIGPGRLARRWVRERLGFSDDGGNVEG